jgi:hemerythrin superfamily protein
MGGRVLVTFMDAITLLRNDHETVEQLFKRFEKAGDRAYVEKRQIVDRIVEELSVHAVVEEQVLYPIARATVPGTEEITLESLEEHHIVKWVLSELAGLDPRDERFDAKVTVLIENVRHHVAEEENELFPKLRSELSRTALADLGDALAEAKKSAPTRPHPRLPDVPPANAVTGAVAAWMDYVGDNISGFAQGTITAWQDFIARFLHTDKPKVSPTGSTVARNRATAVRGAVSTATDGAAETADSVRSGAAATARAASSGAKTTATTVHNSARATKSTAKRAATTTRRTARTAAKRSTATAKRAASKTAAAAKNSR